MTKGKDFPGFETLGDDIKAARQALGLFRRALAERVNIDPRYLANIENSGDLPSVTLEIIVFFMQALTKPVYIGKARWTPAEKTRRNYHNPESIIADSGHEPIIDIHTLHINPVAQPLPQHRPAADHYGRPSSVWHRSNSDYACSSLFLSVRHNLLQEGAQTKRMAETFVPATLSLCVPSCKTPSLQE